MATAHAKTRPPSSAARWLSCHGSVRVAPLHPREESDQSQKGDLAHDLLENALLFGIPPRSENPDVDEGVHIALDYVAERRRIYGPGTMAYAERRLNIPETGEFGTTDVLIVNPSILEVVDFKDGYVAVEVMRNPQLMLYLLGAIAEFGPRPDYRITVVQPNCSHIDGTVRSYDVTHADIELFRAQVAAAVAGDTFTAGPHCKKTYCEHRGACVTFLQWAQNNAADAWFPSEVNGMSNEQLVAALDHAEVLQGLRSELRKEAMRRVLQQDARLPGYKVVKGRKDRQFKDEQARLNAEAALRKLGARDQDLFKPPEPESVAGYERFVKAFARDMGRNTWRTVWDNTVGIHVTEFSGGLTLERATDARPEHRRGSEFDQLAPPPTTTGVMTV